jgi:hypothetical protein
VDAELTSLRMQEPSEDASDTHVHPKNICQTSDVNHSKQVDPMQSPLNAGQVRLQAMAKRQREAIASLQRHAIPSPAVSQLTTDTPTIQHYQPDPQPPPPRVLHMQAKSAIACNTVVASIPQSVLSAQEHPQTVQVLERELKALQQRLEQAEQAAMQFQTSQLVTHDIGKVAAAAAVAAAQAVKKDTDSELSQVLKAVLLQQSRLGMAGGHQLPATGAAVMGAPCAQQSMGDVRVQGHLLVPKLRGMCTVASTTPQA